MMQRRSSDSSSCQRRGSDSSSPLRYSRFHLISVFLVIAMSFANLPTSAQNEPAGAGSSTQEFAFKLFNLVSKGKTDNVVVSPFSISSALSMAMNGAVGKTADEMRETLGLQGTESDINQRYAALTDSLLKVNPKSDLTIANAMFGRQGFTFKKPFVVSNQQYYKARLETLDFSKPETLSIINNWVSQQTRGKIPTIVDQIPPDAFLYLINAIYFKGTWQEKFDEAMTESADFTTLSGDAKKVMMMHRHDKFRYLRGTNFQALALPYQDERLEMVIFLPNKNVDHGAFIASFNDENWNSWLARMRRRSGHLGLPRFKVEYKEELSNALKAAGMPCAFADGCADFSKMVDDPAVISRVLHKTFMEVNEKGTEAAAVTGVEMSVTSAPMNPEQPFEMVCDRPFVVALRDSQTGTILFLGSIAAPPGG